MFAYLIKRLLLLIPTLIGVGTLTFAGPFRIVQDPSRFCHGADHHAVPGCENFVVQQGPDTLTSNFQKFLAGFGEFFLYDFFLHAKFFGKPLR